MATIEFLYSKDSTKEADGWISGIFEVYIDDQLILSDSELNDNPDEWKYFEYDAFPGAKEVTMVYQKFNSEANQNLNLEIKV